MAAKTWTQTSGNLWSTGANWNGGTVPATTDAVTFDNTSTANCTIDNLGTWSGGTFTIAATYSGTITKSVAMTTAAFAQAAGTFSGGSAAMQCTTFALSGGTFTATSGTWTVTGSMTKTNAPTFSANGGTIALSGASNQTIDLADLTLSLVTINKSGGSNTTVSADTTLPLGASPTIVAPLLTISEDGTVTATGTLSQTADSPGGLDVTTGGTISGMTSIVVTNGEFSCDPGGIIPTGLNLQLVTTTNRTTLFAGGGKAYGTLVVSGTGTGKLSFYGSNNFAVLRCENLAAAYTVEFEAASTQTIQEFQMNGSVGKVLTLKSTSDGDEWTLHSASGTKSADYLALQDSTVDVTPIWYAGANSTNTADNTNWVFTAPVAVHGYGPCQRRRRRR